jgi:hypothetical protein
MAPIPPPALTPQAGESGLLSADPDAMITAIESAWSHYLETVDSLNFPSLDPSHVRAIADLGTWPGNPGLTAIIAEAEGRPRVTATQPPPDAIDKTATLTALQRSLDDFRQWTNSPQRDATESVAVTTPLGPLPMLTALHGVSYSQTLTLLPMLGPDDDGVRSLLPYALNALVDTTGAFAARANTSASLVALTASGNVGTGSTAGAWRTRLLDPNQVASPSQLGPRVMADAATLIAVTAGQVDVPRAYRSGQLRFAELGGLMRWVPVLEHVPGMPAAAALGRAASYISGMSGFLSRFGL